MDQKTFTKVATIIFSLVALLHALRLLQGWELVIGSYNAPAWISGVAVIVIGGMAYSGWKLMK
jgi:hypothetical protein